MKQYLKKYWYEFVFSLILVSVFALVVTNKYGYFYSTNDDVMIRNIMNGNFTGTPESYVINVMYLSGIVGKFLYSHVSEVAWFDLAMILFHYICWYLIIVRAGQQVEKKWQKTIMMLITTVLLIAVDWKYLLLNQYTILTAQLAGVSCFWMLTSVGKKSTEYWIDRGITISLFILALLYRKEAFLLSLPVWGLIVLYEAITAFEQKKFFKEIKRIGVCVGICFVLFIITYSVENIAYGKASWKPFLASHNARIQIYDYTGVPSYDIYQSGYSKLDMSYGDWIAMDLYNCEFIDDFDVDKMEGVAQLSEQRWNESNSVANLFKRSVLSYCTSLFENKVQPVGILLVVIYLISLLVSYRNNDKNGLVLCGCMLLFNVIVSVYLIARERFLERVSYGMHFQQILFLMAYLSPYVKKMFQDMSDKKVWKGIFLALCLGGVSIACTYTWQKAIEERAQVVQNAEDWQYINMYFASHPENRYCIDTNSFVFSTEQLFADKVESDNMVRLGGWILNSPLQEKRMNYQQIENLTKQMVEENGFYLVQDIDKDTEWISIIWNAKGYDVEAVVTDVIETPGGRQFAIIQLQ